MHASQSRGGGANFLPPTSLRFQCNSEMEHDRSASWLEWQVSGDFYAVKTRHFNIMRR